MVRLRLYDFTSFWRGALCLRERLKRRSSFCVLEEHVWRSVFVAELNRRCVFCSAIFIDEEGRGILTPEHSRGDSVDFRDLCRSRESSHARRTAQHPAWGAEVSMYASIFGHCIF